MGSGYLGGPPRAARCVSARTQVQFGGPRSGWDRDAKRGQGGGGQVLFAAPASQFYSRARQERNAGVSQKYILVQDFPSESSCYGNTDSLTQEKKKKARIDLTECSTS